LSEPPSPWPEGPHLPLRRPLIELLPATGELPPQAPERPRYLLALTLFVLTLLCTTTLGPVMYMVSRTDVVTDLSTLWGVFLIPRVVVAVWHDPALLHIGLSFSFAAMTILFCHEMGHYIACRRYGLACTLPYFLPVPLNFGTFGAFIKIKAPIRTKRELFDVGVAGPLAGFVALIPFLLYGVAHSKPVVLPHADPAVASQAVEALGGNLAIYLVARLFHGPLAPGTYLNLHPMALGAWLGLFATSLNLLPLGQLDGGHILYAATGRLQRRLAIPLWLGLGLLGWLWPGWILWTLIVLVIGLYHPPVWDEREPLDASRRMLAWLSLVIFILSFMPVPLRLIPV
jgi:membrane-associated protease RseP (regulator of RpoE activity)